MIRAQRKQQIDNRFAGAAVQVSGRLIREDQPRLGDNGAGQRNALLLAAGKLARIMGQTMV